MKNSGEPRYKFYWHQLLIRSKEGHYAITRWEFWRTMVCIFCIFCWVGHAMELPYCLFMDHFFGIVADDYAVWTEPWFTPYWVYGIGVVCITIFLEPWKELIQKRTKHWWVAVIETFIYITLLAAFLETLIGLIINQPNEFGVYPFWDNSTVPLNILGQGWLVNDILLGVMGSLYLWVFYPLIDDALELCPEWLANTITVALLFLLLLSSYFTYLL